MTSIQDCAAFLVQEFQAFAEQHPKVLESVGVSQESALTKARLLALLSLASRSHELSYAHIRVRAAPPGQDWHTPIMSLRIRPAASSFCSLLKACQLQPSRQGLPCA